MEVTCLLGQAGRMGVPVGDLPEEELDVEFADGFVAAKRFGLVENVRPLLESLRAKGYYLGGPRP